ncbi:cupin [Streptomyces sp. NRRL F-4489]|uniref:cupin domain-containing protein n=1 Tax=Streptomyces sp. NRRL F-4489 TaxID=1609095 RepID=UPI000749EB41|nr:cupin domain-containing protein [Streptomyces sp. NRRL F-4489]KUL39364.1 cupin [Streptomyces sp. NRRL F-4489]
MNGIVVGPGGGRKLITPAQEITFKVTGADGSGASVFEVVVPPGFDVGAHKHHHSQELFFVVEGELEIFAFEPEHYTEADWTDWKSAAGDRPVRATAGSVAFVPQGCPHAFANRTAEPARVLFAVSPSPQHELYFDRLAEIFAAPGPPDAEAIERLREEYDITQLTPLRHERPQPAGAGHRAEERTQ